MATWNEASLYTLKMQLPISNTIRPFIILFSYCFFERFVDTFHWNLSQCRTIALCLAQMSGQPCLYSQPLDFCFEILYDRDTKTDFGWTSAALIELFKDFNSEVDGTDITDCTMHSIAEQLFSKLAEHEWTLNFYSDSLFPLRTASS